MRLVAIYVFFILIGFSSCQKDENFEPKVLEREKEFGIWELYLILEGKEYIAESTSSSEYGNSDQLIGEAVIFSGQTIWASFRYQYNCKDVFMRGYINGTSFIVNNPDCAIINSSNKNSNQTLQYTLNFCHGESNVPVELRISRK